MTPADPPPTPTGPRPTLSMGLYNFAASDPGSWDQLIDLAVAADEAGVDRLVVSDHVVFGEALDAYGDPTVGGTVGGRQPTGPDGHWLEPLALLSYLAAATSTIRLATGILIGALRRPVVLAKQAATIDVLSGGRLDLGVGVGWQREEYEAAGLSFAERGQLLDHTLEVCQTLWTSQAAHHHSDRLRFDRIHQMPKPRQPGGVPVWVSGTANPRVVRRVVRFGSGWIPWGPDVTNPAPGIAVLRRALDDAGRGDDRLAVVGTLPGTYDADGRLDVTAITDHVPELLAAGVTDFKMRPPRTNDPGALAEQLATVVAAFRSATAAP